MTTTRSLLAPLALAAALAGGCNEAKFYGAAPAKGRIEPTPPPAAPTCVVVPPRITLGETATVTVTAPLSDATLYQTIIAGEARQEATLTRAGEAFTSKGQPVTLTPPAAGTQTIELRRVQGAAEPDVVCSLEVVVAVPPPCQDSEGAVGAHVAFLIDNSNSNAATDCPAPTRTGTFRGSDLYKCGGETHREQAVLAAYDVLATVAAQHAGRAEAQSSLAVGSFPTRADFVGGWAKATDGMVAADGATRQSVAAALAVSREPFGLTPYGAALTGAAALFDGLADDGKARVAVLVTDGDPTDPDPAGVAAQAAALAAKGISVITVLYGAEGRAKRFAQHTALMRSIDAASVKAGLGPWYARTYATFEAYMAALLGDPGHKALAETISAGGVVEVKDSAALTEAFLAIIKTKAIKCGR